MMDKDEKQKRAHQMLRRARAWVKNNPRAWQLIKKLALADYSKNYPMSIQKYVEITRAKDFVPDDGGVFHITNDNCAAFARFLLADHPEYARLLVTRKSMLDDLPEEVKV